jgi:hypothetical protein
MLALLTRTFRAAACVVGGVGSSGEQAPRCPASHHQQPSRHPRRMTRYRRQNIHQFGMVLRTPRWAAGREQPRPPGRRVRERQRSDRRRPRRPTLIQPRPAGLLYVPKMSARRLRTGSRPASFGRSMHLGCGSRTPRWSRRLQHSSSRRHRGPAARTVLVPNRNPDGSASRSAPVSCDSDGPIPCVPRRPPSGQSAITNVTLTMRSSMSETTSPSQMGTMIRPSCLRHDGVLRKTTSAVLAVSLPSGPGNHGRRCAAPSPNSTTPLWWNPVVFRRWSP